MSKRRSFHFSLFSQSSQAAWHVALQYNAVVTRTVRFPQAILRRYGYCKLIAGRFLAGCLWASWGGNQSQLKVYPTPMIYPWNSIDTIAWVIYDGYTMINIYLILFNYIYTHNSTSTTEQGAQQCTTLHRELFRFGRLLQFGRREKITSARVSLALLGGCWLDLPVSRQMWDGSTCCAWFPWKVWKILDDL